MRTPTPENVTLADGLLTGVSVIPPETTGAPVILYLHGGGGTYTEGIRGRVPQLPFAARAGFPGYSINRPDNLDSATLGLPSEIDEGFYTASADRIDLAAADIWRRHGDTAPGIVLQGCSVGGAIALTLAARWSERDAGGEATWPLLGVIASDVGHALRPGVSDALNREPEEMHVEDALHTVAHTLDFGPAWAKDDLPEGDPLTVPRAEILELVGGWPRNALSTARAIRVPVMWRLAELDPLWDGGDEQVAAFVDALRTSSPYVDGTVVDGAIHPLFESRRGFSFTLETLSFVELCRVLAVTPQILDPSSR